MDALKRIMAHLNSSHSAYHAVREVENELKEAGFVEIFEESPFKLEKGKSYFLNRNGSALIAFKIPECDFHGFHIAASHSDSPTFKLKHNPCFNQNGYIGLRVEPYGGMIMSTWFDRPLSLAGRLLVEKEGKIRSHLFAIEEDVAIIPNLCIHFNRNINEGHAYNPDTEIIPIMGEFVDGFNFDSYIKEKAGLTDKDTVLDEDLFLYVREEARLMGANGDILGSQRLDNLTSVFASSSSLALANPNASIPLLCAFDNEEVGSGSRQGADGDFLERILTRICRVFDKNIEEEFAKSFMLSIDNAHARHPNYASTFERSSDVKLNKGVVLKYNATLRYTTDGYSAAVVRSLAKKANVDIQTFSNRPDIRGGGTLGNIALSHASIPTADIGLAQFAMHSCFETLGAKDIEQMERLIRHFFDCDIIISEGEIEIR